MDPISIAAGSLGAKFLEEGIKFLWSEAAKILDRYHKRRETKDSGKVNDPAPAGLALPRERTIDFGAVGQRVNDLENAIGSLGIYTSGARPMSPDDRNLLEKADALQRLIAEIYGIPAPKLRVRGESEIDTIEGNAIVNELTGVDSADVEGKLKSKRVKKGATATVNRIKR